MRKKRWISLLLIAVFAFGGCDAKPDNPDINNPDYVKPAYEETGKNLLSDGYTEYEVVIPADANVYTRFAAEELQFFFNEATGVKLPIVTDTDRKWTTESKYISIGKTSLASDAGLTTEGKKLGSSGFIMDTEGDSVFILGNTDRANVYGSYVFLNSVIDYEFYCEDCYYLNKNVKKIPLYDYKVTDVPDIEYRCAAYGWASENQENLMRYRQSEFFDLFVNINGQPFHNSMEYLPVAKYKKDHPKWYATNGNQLSYTAQGDEKEYALMVETVADIMKENIMAQPGKQVITMSIMDEPTFDSSPASVAMREKYGSDSASIILFLNDVNKIIREWFKTDEGKPYDNGIEILFFAYMKAEAAPVETDSATGEFRGKNGIHCDEGVSVFYAPIYIDYLRSIDDPINRTYSESIRQWAAVSDNIFMWTYNGNFKNYLLPYDTFNGIGDLYKKAAKSGVRWMLNQSQFETTTVASGYAALKQYLDSKLAWDSSLNVKTLIENFMNNYYGEAAEGMKKNLDSFRAHSEWVKDNCSGYSENFSCESYLMQEKYFPKQTVMMWYEQLNDVISNLDYLKEISPERYNTIYCRVANERLSWLYMLIELYEYNSLPETVYKWKQQFKADNDLIGGGTRGGAGGDGEDFIPNLYKGWKI